MPTGPACLRQAHRPRPRPRPRAAAPLLGSRTRPPCTECACTCARLGTRGRPPRPRPPSAAARRRRALGPPCGARGAAPWHAAPREWMGSRGVRHLLVLRHLLGRIDACMHGSKAMRACMCAGFPLGTPPFRLGKPKTFRFRNLLTSLPRSLAPSRPPPLLACCSFASLSDAKSSCGRASWSPKRSGSMPWPRHPRPSGRPWSGKGSTPWPPSQTRQGEQAMASFPDQARGARHGVLPRPGKGSKPWRPSQTRTAAWTASANGNRTS
jgi:hypothetical protein